MIYIIRLSGIIMQNFRRERRKDMGLYTYNSESIPKPERVSRLIDNLFAKMPEIESARAILITESYKATKQKRWERGRRIRFPNIIEK